MTPIPHLGRQRSLIPDLLQPDDLIQTSGPSLPTSSAQLPRVSDSVLGNNPWSTYFESVEPVPDSVTQLENAQAPHCSSSMQNMSQTRPASSQVQDTASQLARPTFHSTTPSSNQAEISPDVPGPSSRPPGVSSGQVQQQIRTHQPHQTATVTHSLLVRPHLSHQRM